VHVVDMHAACARGLTTCMLLLLLLIPPKKTAPKPDAESRVASRKLVLLVQ
jgi:hypothetical protein